MAVVIYDGRDTRPRKKWRIGWLLLALVLLGGFAYAAWTLIKYKTDDIRDDRYYESLREEYPFRGAVTGQRFADVPDGIYLTAPSAVIMAPETPLAAPDAPDAPKPAPAQAPQESQPKPIIAPDATTDNIVSGQAWIYCPGTAIDYPVMPWASGDYWLTHLPNGKYSAKGTPFLDSRCDGVTGNVIIYAHNMIDGSMFGSLKAYADASYRSAHRTMWLYAGEDTYRLDVAAAYFTDVNDECYLMPEDISGIVSQHGGTWPDDISEYAILSTCAYDRGDERFVVILTKR